MNTIRTTHNTKKTHNQIYLYPFIYKGECISAIKMNQIILEHKSSNEPTKRFVVDKITVKECDLQSELEILLYREVLTLKNHKESMFKTIGKFIYKDILY
jgi:hypothetical protein